MPLNHFDTGRKNMSAWYVAILISFFVFQPLKEVIIRIADFSIRMLTLANIRITDQNGIWLILFLVCFLMTLAIKHFFVDNLSINIDKDGGGSTEKTILAFLICGMYLYVFNRIFIEQPMPTFFPRLAVNLFGGYADTFTASGDNLSGNTWIIVHGLLWHLAPVAFFWIGANVDKG